MSRKKKAASVEERREARRKRQRRKRTSRKIAVTLLLLIGVCIGICFTPVFSVKEIRVSGTNQVPAEQISASSGVSVGQNIFTFNIHEVAERLKQIPYVDEVTVHRNYPNVLSVEVREAVPVAYVSIGGGFAVIDKTARVLEGTEDRAKYKIPLISQEEIGNYTLGEKLTVAKEGSFPVLLEAAVAVSNNQFSDRITDIYSEEKEVYMKISDTLKIKLGSGEKLSAKMNMLKAVLENLPKGSKGTLDMTNGEKVYLTSDG